MVISAFMRLVQHEAGTVDPGLVPVGGLQGELKKIATAQRSAMFHDNDADNAN